MGLKCSFIHLFQCTWKMLLYLFENYMKWLSNYNTCIMISVSLFHIYTILWTLDMYPHKGYPSALSNEKRLILGPAFFFLIIFRFKLWCYLYTVCNLSWYVCFNFVFLKYWYYLYVVVFILFSLLLYFNVCSYSCCKICCSCRISCRISCSCSYSCS